MSPTPVPKRTRSARTTGRTRTGAGTRPVDRRAAGPIARGAAAALAVVPATHEAPADRSPGLRVVDDARLRLAARQRRMRVLAVVAGVVVCASVFALAAFHAMLVSGQTRLDELEQAVAVEQDRYERLRADVAAAESPARIVEVARDELGMVPPEGVEWLAPGERATPRAPSESSGRTGGGGVRTWAAMKSQLGGAG